MTVETGGEATSTATTTAAPEAAVSSQERDYEAEASEQGWRPQEEWTGKPEHWKDARTWVENGDTKTRIAKVEKDYAERFERLERSTRTATEALTASYERQIADLRAEKKAAIKEGDEARVDEIDDKIDALKEKKPAASKEAKGYDAFADDYQPEANSPDHSALVAGFMAANAWMVEEPDMADYAAKVSELNATAKPGIGFKANMKHVEAMVRKKFPAYFNELKEAAANGHAAVDAGGAFSGSTRNARKTFSDLPKEAQNTYERFDPKIKAVLSKEQYTKEYLADA